MGKTHAAKEKERSQRLQSVPKKERLAKSAGIKRKEGRILNAAEKHAVKMSGDYGTIMSAWEVLRTIADEKGGTRGDHAKKDEAVKNLLKLLLPQFEQAARTPRMSRVIQSCLKHGSPGQLQQILVAMSKDFVAYCTDPYAHFIVCALLRHASHDLFRKTLNLILGAMTQLVSSKFGALVIHTAYSIKMCSATDRHIITLGVFKDSVAVMRQWKGYPILEDILDQEEDHKRRLIKSLFDLLDKLVSQKEAFGYPFVQRLLCAFFSYGGKEEITELAVSLKPHVGVFCDSREGSILAAQVVAVLPPKQRKEALQSFKEAIGGEGVLGLCLAKYSAPLMARLFDVIYDGQILWKFLSGVISENIGEILSSPYAHMVLLHLLTPDSERKTRALLPGYAKDYNLYSRENDKWNHMTWLDSHGTPETVNICSHPANLTHAIGIQQVVPAVVAFARGDRKTEEKKASNNNVKSFDDEDDEEDAQPTKKNGGVKRGSDLFVARIAKELVHLLDNDEEYAVYVKKAFGKQLDGKAASEEEAAAAEELIRSLAPRNKVTRDEMEARGQEEEMAPVATTKKSQGPQKSSQTPNRPSQANNGGTSSARKSASAAVASARKSPRISAIVAAPMVEDDEEDAVPVATETPNRRARRASAKAATPADLSGKTTSRQSAEKSPRFSATSAAPIEPVEEDEGRPSKKRRLETSTTKAASVPSAGAKKAAAAPVVHKTTKSQQLRVEAMNKKKEQNNSKLGKKF